MNPQAHAARSGLIVRRAGEHQRVPWANGGGTTREVIAMPPMSAGAPDRSTTATPWRWRLSIADVDAEGPFSVLPGVQRTIALVRGDGFVLSVGNDAPKRIDVAFQPFRFDGGESTDCALIGGAVVDLNLMERGDQRTLRLHFTEVASGGCFEASDVVAVLPVMGAAAVCVAAQDGLNDAAPTVLQQLDALISTSPCGVVVSVRSTGSQCVVALVSVVAA